MNYLHTAKGDFDGIARNFIARYLLDATSLDDAWERIRSTPHCVGHNYQIMDLTNGYTVDIEVAPLDTLWHFQAILTSIPTCTVFSRLTIHLQQVQFIGKLVTSN